MFAAIGAAVVYPLIRINIRIAPKLGLIDWPKARGVTEEQIPIIGHSLVVVSIGALVILMRFYEISPWFPITALIIGVMGHFDDRRPLPAIDKMFFQVVCVGAVVLLDPQIHQAISEKYGTSGTLWAIFFILGLMNAVNFVDGIDGLAGSVIAFGSFGFLLLAYANSMVPETYPHIIYASLLLGMTIPFLIFNVLYRKGFLGNVGSYFFSYVLGVIHLSLPINAAGPVSRLSLSGLCFLIPVADAIMVVLARMLTLRSPLKPDKGHLHHRMIQTSIPLRQILLCFGIIEGSSVLVAFFLLRDPGISKSILPIIFGLAQIGIVTMMILITEAGSKRRLRSYFQVLEKGEPIYFLKYKVVSRDGNTLALHALRRLEAKVCAEIRVTDLCYVEAPDTLCVILRSPPDPLRGISNRLEIIFQGDNLHSTLIADQGEFIKVSRQEKASVRARAKAI